MATVKAIPDGYHNVTPYLFIRGAGAAIDFYKKAFGAKELVRMSGPIGQVMHAELQIGDSIVMLADENPKMGAMSPQTAGGISISLHIYTEHVDHVVRESSGNRRQTLAARAKPILRGPQRHSDRPVRAHVVDSNPRGRCVPGRDEKTNGRSGP